MFGYPDSAEEVCITALLYRFVWSLAFCLLRTIMLREVWRNRAIHQPKEGAEEVRDGSGHQVEKVVSGVPLVAIMT